MKKALSVFLAVLMICGCFAVGASAATTTVNQTGAGWIGEGDGYAATYDQVLVSFDTNGGIFKNAVEVFDDKTGTHAPVSEVTGVWIMVPNHAGDTTMRPGTTIQLPSVTAPSGKQFEGWYCEEEKGYRTVEWTIPTTLNGQPTAGTIVHFRAQYSPAQEEEPTLNKILDVLAKVFGAIVGILLYKGDTEAGITLVKNMLSGIMG